MSDEQVFEESSDEVWFPIVDPNSGEERRLRFRLARDLYGGVAGPTYLLVDDRPWIGADDIPRVVSILQDFHQSAERVKWSGQ